MKTEKFLLNKSDIKQLLKRKERLAAQFLNNTTIRAIPTKPAALWMLRPLLGGGYLLGLKFLSSTLKLDANLFPNRLAFSTETTTDLPLRWIKDGIKLSDDEYMLCKSLCLSYNWIHLEPYVLRT